MFGPSGAALKFSHLAMKITRESCKKRACISRQVGTSRERREYEVDVREVWVSGVGGHNGSWSGQKPFLFSPWQIIKEKASLHGRRNVLAGRP